MEVLNLTSSLRHSIRFHSSHIRYFMKPKSQNNNHTVLYGTKYSRMDQGKPLEDRKF